MKEQSLSSAGISPRALSAMVVGTGSWALHLLAGAERFLGPWWLASWVPLPVGLCCAGLALAAYLLAERG